MNRTETCLQSPESVCQPAFDLSMENKKKTPATELDAIQIAVIERALSGISQ